MATTTATIASRLAPTLKPRGFRRKGGTFVRVLGDVTQVVNIQGSQYGGGTFFVNIALTFGAIRKLRASNARQAIGGVGVDWSERLAPVRRGVPKSWTVTAATTDAVATTIAKLVGGVVDELDAIDSATAMLGWKRFAPVGFLKLLRAQLRWVTGDRRGARADVRAIATEFADRQACTVAELTRSAGLR